MPLRIDGKKLEEMSLDQIGAALQIIGVYLTEKGFQQGANVEDEGHQLREIFHFFNTGQQG